MDIIATYGYIWQKCVEFLSIPIPLGFGIEVSLWSLILAGMIFSIVAYVIYKLTY